MLLISVAIYRRRTTQQAGYLEWQPLVVPAIEIENNLMLYTLSLKVDDDLSLARWHQSNTCWAPAEFHPDMHCETVSTFNMCSQQHLNIKLNMQTVDHTANFIHYFRQQVYV